MWLSKDAPRTFCTLGASQLTTFCFPTQRWKMSILLAILTKILSFDKFILQVKSSLQMWHYNLSKLSEKSFTWLFRKSTHLENKIPSLFIYVAPKLIQDSIYSPSWKYMQNIRNMVGCPHSLHGNWDWMKNLLSFVPKGDSKTVQLDLLGVAVIFFS